MPALWYLGEGCAEGAVRAGDGGGLCRAVPEE